MKGINLICPFVIFCVILSSLSSSSSGETILGKIMCDTNGLIKTECQAEDMPVESFPKECSSFFYSGVYVYPNGTLEDPNETRRPAGNLDKIGCLGKPVILMVVRIPWWECLQGIKADPTLMEAEIAGWKVFLAKHPSISAMAIYKAEMAPEDAEDPDYTTNLVNWICVMKTNFPEMKIGMYLSIAAMVKTNNQLKGIDLKTLDCSLDFYRLASTTAEYVLNCDTLEGKYGDVIMNGCNKEAQEYLNGLMISKDKIVWDIWGTPTNANMSDCELTYPNMCLNPNGTYCASTLKDYYDKGNYFKDAASGVCLNSIDFDDANGVCCCGKFPIFYALYNGITGGAAPEECCLIDRPV